MIALLVSILMFWIIWRMLRSSLLIEPPPPPPPLQIVIHIHSAQVLVQTRDR
jgi:hypothetical protein